MKAILTLCALAICGAFTLHAADGAKPKKPSDRKPGEGRRSPEEIFKKLDSNGDGVITKDEFMAGPRAKEDPTKAGERFKALDKKGNGKITLEEFKAAGPGKRPDGAPKKPAEGDKK